MPAKKFRIHYVLFGLVLGVIVGALGTALHRTAPPLGLILALIATASLVVAMRSLMGWTGLLSSVIGWAVTVQFLALGRKAGDVLIAGDSLGYGWLLGGILCLFVGLLLPISLFNDDKDRSEIPARADNTDVQITSQKE